MDFDKLESLNSFKDAKAFWGDVKQDPKKSATEWERFMILIKCFSLSTTFEEVIFVCDEDVDHLNDDYFFKRKLFTKLMSFCKTFKEIYEILDLYGDNVDCLEEIAFIKIEELLERER